MELFKTKGDLGGPECGRTTPIFGWSPLPQRKDLKFTSKTDNKTTVEQAEDLYPNTDATIWLRSCEEEIIEPIEGTIQGTIPGWVQGSLYRNGPGSLKVGDMEFQHLFDSSALLHRFNIDKGKVTYQCRFLETSVFKRNRAAKRIVVTEFGTSAVPDPCQTIFNKIAVLFKPGEVNSDNAMISVYPFGDELYAFTESPVIHRFHPETLATEERLDVSRYVSIVNHTSHPHVMNDGTVFNLGLSVTKRGPMYNIMKFPGQKNDPTLSEKAMFEEAHIVASIPTRWPLHPGYMHTFGITDNYYIIVEQPLSVSIAAMLKAQIQNEPFASSLKWFSDEPTCIHVINRKDGSLEKTFYAKAFFYLHIINQYEISDHVVIDICCYRDPAMLDCMYVETMKNMQKMPDYAKMFRGRPLRFVLPIKVSTENKTNVNPQVHDNIVQIPNTKARAYLLSDGRIFVTPERLCNLGCETPRIDYENHLGKDYKYFYAINSDVDAENSCIIKVDVKNKTTITWAVENCYPSEPIFIPRPDASDEDDGVILSAMVWGGDDTNHVGLLVLDAKTWTEIGRAEFHTPGPVPKCLHGWFSDRTKQTN